MSNRWIFKCKNCGADITFQIVDVSSVQAAQPAKPLIVKKH